MISELQQLLHQANEAIDRAREALESLPSGTELSEAESDVLTNLEDSLEDFTVMSSCF